MRTELHKRLNQVIHPGKNKACASFLPLYTRRLVFVNVAMHGSLERDTLKQSLRALVSHTLVCSVVRIHLMYYTLCSYCVLLCS